MDSDEKLDLQIRVFISAVNSDTFSEQQHKIIKIIEKELGKPLPEETKNSILGKCDKN